MQCMGCREASCKARNIGKQKPIKTQLDIRGVYNFLEGLGISISLTGCEVAGLVLESLWTLLVLSN